MATCFGLLEAIFRLLLKKVQYLTNNILNILITECNLYIILINECKQDLVIVRRCSLYI